MRDHRLATLTGALLFDPVPVDESVAAEWARLLLRDSGQRMPVSDSWIAATALALGVPVVTQDDDCPEIGDLDVIKVCPAHQREELGYELWLGARRTGLVRLGVGGR